MVNDPPPEQFRLTPGDPLAALAGWVADGIVDAAAAERGRRHRLERQATEEATLAGVLVDLAEGGRPVLVRTAQGGSARGIVVALGADFVIVRTVGVGDVVVPLRAVASVRAAPGDRPVAGARPLALTAGLTDVVVELSAEQPTVAVVAGGEHTRGVLDGAGRDVLSLRQENPRREIVHIATAAVDHLVVTGA